jgi:hypothetical protein
MSSDARAEATRLAARHVRNDLRPDGVAVLIDWGDGELTMWVDAKPTSPLMNVAEDVEQRASSLGKLVR